jgi:molybdate transport system substrate-binding protein
MVFAAASLSEAFTALGEHFLAENPGEKITFNFAGSQQLAQQLAQGAPADIFASADRKQMDVAIQAGRVSSESLQPFAQNRLVLVFPKANPAGLSQLEDLSKSGLKLILAAEAAPVGRYSLDFLEKASQDSSFGSGFKDEVLKNVVSYEENVRAVLSKVILGEADAGIVYASDISRANVEQVGSLAIPDDLNVLADYYLSPITDSQTPDLAKNFITFVLSTTGQDILARYGLIPLK